MSEADRGEHVEQVIEDVGQIIEKVDEKVDESIDEKVHVRKQGAESQVRKRDVSQVDVDGTKDDQEDENSTWIMAVGAIIGGLFLMKK